MRPRLLPLLLGTLPPPPLCERNKWIAPNIETPSCSCYLQSWFHEEKLMLSLMYVDGGTLAGRDPRLPPLHQHGGLHGARRVPLRLADDGPRRRWGSGGLLRRGGQGSNSIDIFLGPVSGPETCQSHFLDF